MPAEIPRKRIVFYANCLGKGGAHHSMLAWLELLRDHPAAELKIYCAAEGWFADELRQRGLGYELLPMPEALRRIRHGQWTNRLRTAWSVVTMTAGLARAWARIAGARADVLVLTGGRDFIMLFPLALRKRRVTVTIPQTTDWAEIPTCRMMCRLAARTYAISQAVADSIVAMGVPAARVSVEPLIYTADHADRGFDPAEIRRELGLPKDAPVVGMTGVVRPHKGQREAVRAFALVLQRVPNAHLLIVGSPPPDAADAVAYDAAVKGLVAELGLQDRIHFAGWRADVPRIMRAMDVMLVPSHDFEGVPRVILEGLEAGLPIVASDLPQFREVLTRLKVGQLHALDRLEPWAETISKLLLEAPFRAAASRAARAVWEAEYSVASVRPRIAAAFLRLAAPPGR